MGLFKHINRGRQTKIRLNCHPGGRAQERLPRRGERPALLRQGQRGAGAVHTLEGRNRRGDAELRQLHHEHVRQDALHQQLEGADAGGQANQAR